MKDVRETMQRNIFFTKLYNFQLTIAISAN